MQSVQVLEFSFQSPLRLQLSYQYSPRSIQSKYPVIWWGQPPDDQRVVLLLPPPYRRHRGLGCFEAVMGQLNSQQHTVCVASSLLFSFLHTGSKAITNVMWMWFSKNANDVLSSFLLKWISKANDAHNVNGKSYSFS